MILFLTNNVFTYDCKFVKSKEYFNDIDKCHAVVLSNYISIN